MKLHDKVVAIGYRYVKPTSDKSKTWPEWLEEGIHSITHLKKNEFGTLVKTDKQKEFWVNTNFFNLV